jgi:hypothetical protein
MFIKQAGVSALYIEILGAMLEEACLKKWDTFFSADLHPIL